MHSIMLVMLWFCPQDDRRQWTEKIFEGAKESPLSYVDVLLWRGVQEDVSGRRCLLVLGWPRFSLHEGMESHCSFML